MTGRSILLLSALLWLLAAGIGMAAPSAEFSNGISGLELSFTPNQGQWDQRISYRCEANGATLWITKDAIYYQLSVVVEGDAAMGKLLGESIAALSPEQIRPEPIRVETEMIKVTFDGGSLGGKIRASGLTDYYCNFFLGNDRAKWKTRVPNYQEILIEDVYPGIDLKYLASGHDLEYEFVARPGSDPSVIRVRYEASRAMKITSEGDLSVTGKLGQVTEVRPVFYQETSKGRRTLPGRFRLYGDNSFGFEAMPEFDTARPTVIDPKIKFSTFLGGSSNDEAYGIDASAGGNCWVTGYTTSSNFPHVSPFDSTYNSGWDVFVTKLSTSGNSLVYSTYIGGSGDDLGRYIDEDTYGDVAIAGYTQSSNFPLSNAYDTTLGGSRDAFWLRMSTDGTGLVLSSYLGGSGLDDGFGVVADPNATYYVTGYTQSSDFPMVNAFDNSFNGGTNDAFVSKFSALGWLSYSTYLGGNGSEISWEIKVEGGHIYVAGSTASTNFPLANAFDSTQNGNKDLFVTKFASNGASLDYSTYVGGSGQDEGLGLVINSSGEAFVTGITASSNYPTASAFDASYNGGYDAFVTKLGASGNTISYSTFIGGASADYAYAIALDTKINAGGSALICGRTESSTFPMQNPADNSYGGSIDAFVTKVVPLGTALSYSSYLGGSSQDLGLGIGIDDDCFAYATGSTQSTGFYVVNAYDSTHNGSNDVYIVKLAPYTCGDLTGDAQVDTFDLAFLIDYAFSSGPAPCPIDASDYDGDGSIDIVDVSYLVDYLYRGGSAPQCQP